MAVTPVTRYVFKRLARARIKEMIESCDSITRYNTQHPTKALLDGPTSAAIATVRARMVAALAEKA